MPWFRMDDKAAFHAKVLKAGNEAFGAFVRMGCWCSGHLTDGNVPLETALIIANRDTLERLCAIGFLETNGTDYVIHDYLQYNWSAEEVEQRREEISDARSRAGKKGAESRWQNGKRDGKHMAHTHTHTHEDQNTDTASRFDFDAAYELYPRKEGKRRGMQRFHAQIRTQEQYDSLLAAIKNYAATVSDPKYYKHFSSFMACWEDYAKPVSTAPIQIRNPRERDAMEVLRAKGLR
jgi:hypothetical protein